MFLPCTREEMRRLGWAELDVILVTGDAYIDSPFMGVAVIGRILHQQGFRVGVIAQPDLSDGRDILRLGEPVLFWGITSGAIDSMVANRTASGKRRKSDDYTPGGRNTRRPDRAVIVYANLIRGWRRTAAPLVLGGIEASLRRIAHYDAWEDRIRRSILFDAKADYLLYGMAERSIVELARALAAGAPTTGIRGLCHIAAQPPEEALVLPSFQTVAEDQRAFTDMFRIFYDNNDPVTARPLAQQQDTRFLIHNPPQPALTSDELDAVHELPYERELHPLDRQRGEVRALETIRFALTTHRGCYGECRFCAIAMHQGRAIQQRSPDSLVREARQLTQHPAFKGIIADVGGPTANMYGMDCAKKQTRGACRNKSCLFPIICPELPLDHGPLIGLLRRLRGIEGVRKVVVASGLRHDLILADQRRGQDYLRELIRHHVSGQLKLAPEHAVDHVLRAMGKPGADALIEFRRLFNRLGKEEGERLFLTYYLIAAHPGCNLDDMHALLAFCRKELRLIPRQVQLFTPTPCTWSTLMYRTGTDPFTGAPCFVEQSTAERERQRQVLVAADRPAGRTPHEATPKRSKRSRPRKRRS